MLGEPAPCAYYTGMLGTAIWGPLDSPVRHFQGAVRWIYLDLT
jgi:hypothetical protein